MNKIIIRKLHIHANHGVMDQEQTVGADFTINLEITTDFSGAILTDNIEGTISYADVYNIIKEEMAKPSRLLEYAGGRIVKELFNNFESIKAVRLQLLKDNPPLGADCEGMGIEIVEER